MIFTFEDGTTKEYKLGTTVRGLHIKGQRPQKCMIDSSEFVESDWVHMTDPKKVIGYLYRLKFVLAR